MVNERRVEQPERGLELCRQRSLAVAHDGQSAAVRWSLGTERGEDGMAAGRHRLAGELNVASALRGVDEEVENSAVVPNVHLI